MLMLTILAAAAPAAASPAAAATPPNTYRALGTEPFWNVVVEGRQLRLSEPGKPEVLLLVRSPVATARGWRWRNPAVTMETERRPCSDGMSDRRFPDRVTVTYRGRTLRGCGGAAAGAAALAGTGWRVTAIDGRTVRLPRAATLRFTADRMEGFSGCNRFSGDYALERDRLAPGPLRSTRMACIGAGGAVETRLMAILGAPATLRWQGKETLVLRGTGGTRGTVTLRRE